MTVLSLRGYSPNAATINTMKNKSTSQVILY